MEEEDDEEKGRGKWRRGLVLGLIRRSAMAAAAATAAGGGVHSFLRPASSLGVV